MRPALHFLALGALLFALERLTTGGAGVPVGVARAGHAAGVADDDLLWREALAMGLDRTDPLVKRRLAQIGELVTSGDVEDPADYEREARRLGLTQTDVVVRRHLVQAMRLALSRGGPDEMPREDEVTAYFSRHRDRWTQPSRVRFRHVYFARDRAGVPASEAASAALTRLQASSGANANVRGDAFLDGADFALYGPEVERRFGAAFARDVALAPVGRWSGPLHSSYGLHLVWIVERDPASPPSLDEVRGQVVHALLADEAAARLERRLAERRGHSRTVERTAAAW